MDYTAALISYRIFAYLLFIHNLLSIRQSPTTRKIWKIFGVELLSEHFTDEVECLMQKCTKHRYLFAQRSSSSARRSARSCERYLSTRPARRRRTDVSSSPGRPRR